jgi:N-methylhydantoinase B
MVDLAELRMRQRLLELPDGVATSTDYMDHDGHEDRIFRVRLRLEKRGDELTFDFSETSPQAKGFINCTFSGLLAGISAGMSPLIAYDLPFNEGLLRPLHIVAPEGSLVNARHPAPTSMSSVGAVYSVNSVVVSALSQLLATSPLHRRESSARPRGAISIINVTGIDRDRERFGTMLLDGLAGGSGAWANRDGLHAYGTYSMLEPNIANVEQTENVIPLLFLYRKLLPDSGGPGACRGGLGAGFAFTPHDVDEMEAVLVSHGVRVPNATGLFGGLPGSCTVNVVLRGTDLYERCAAGRNPAALEDLRGELVDLGPKPGRFHLVPGDVLAWEAQGGGGYGDPRDRDPELVAADVAEGAVSEDVARRVYGVVLAGGRVEVVATDALRGGTGRDPNGPVPEGLSLGEGLVLAGGRVFCACGRELGSAGSPWELVPARPPQRWGRESEIRPELELVGRGCAGCGRLHEVWLTEAGVDPVDGLLLFAPAEVSA